MFFEISDFSLFFMEKLQSLPLLKKPPPLFWLPPKIEILSGPLFSKFGRRLNPPAERVGREGGGRLVQTMEVDHFKKNLTYFFEAIEHFLVHLDILTLMNNNYTLESLRRVCKQKTDMFTT